MHPDVLHRDTTPQPYSVQTHTNTICNQVRYTCILGVVGNFTDGLYKKIQKTLEFKKILACFKMNYTSNLVQPSYKGKLQDTYTTTKDNYPYVKNEMTRLFQNSNLNAFGKVESLANVYLVVDNDDSLIYNLSTNCGQGAKNGNRGE